MKRPTIAHARQLAMLLALFAFSGVGAAAANGWDAFLAAFIEANFHARPHHAVWAGRHEFDGHLPDRSAQGMQREIARLHAARRRAAAFRDGDLDARQRFERDYLIAVIDDDLFWMAVAKLPSRDPSWYAWGVDPNVYVAREYAPLEQRMRGYVAYLRGIPRATRQIRENLRPPLPRTFIRIGRIAYGGLAEFYENDVPSIFVRVHDPKLWQEFRTANAAAIAAMKELDAWLARQEATATDDFALGPDRFTAMLRIVYGIELPLARVRDIAERDLERNLAALREACDAFLPGASLEACVAKERTEKLKGGALDAAAAQLTVLRDLVIRKQLVTVTGNAQARVAESAPYERWNFAYVRVPGPYEQGLQATYYIAPPDPAWTPEEQQAYIPPANELLFVSAHEVWPGHFLQFQHSNRSASMLGRLFANYAFNEGWAHYAEELMWEAGLGGGDPAVHIGQLLNALLRNVRLISALGLHTSGMTVEESEALFRDKAFLNPAAARQQAARGTFDPGYGAYTLGKLMIRKLRDDWTGSRGGRDAWQAFHDQLLSYGAPPLSLLRREMMKGAAGEPL